MKTLLTLILLLVSFASLAAGTSVSSGFSITTGTSFTSIDQHGSYNSSGHGYSESTSYNNEGFDFRKEAYSVEVDTETEGNGFSVGGFVNLKHSSSAGIISTSAGQVTGGSYLQMNSESHTDVDISGSYEQFSLTHTANNVGWNYEGGNFSSHDHERTATTSHSMTGYSTEYSNTSFNY